MIRYGIISTAQVVPRFVAGVKESQTGMVVAIASRGIEKAQQAAEKLGIPQAYGSYEELYADPAVDIVYIATYNKGHYDAAKQALIAGKPVLLEKPFTLSASEAKELFELAQQRGLFLMEAQKSLFLPVTQAVRQALREGRIGAVKKVASVTSYPHIDHITWFHDLSAGGGALHSSGSYPLQYMQYITDRKISAISGNAILPAGESDLQTELSLKLAQDVLADIFLTVELDLPSGMTVYGTKGEIHIPNFWKTDTATIHTAAGEEVLSFPYQSEFVYEITHVNECLEKGLIESPVMTHQLTLDTVEKVARLYQQWQQ